MTMTPLKSPFPYFGGKRKVARLIWRRFGDVRSYVEPFFGSGAVLLGRPQPFEGVETVNDKDGFISNFWRAIQANPEVVAKFADWPVNENDLHARHAWLVNQAEGMTAKLEGDPEYYDPKIAGWWAWGMAVFIGSGFCSGNGPWQSVEMDDGSRQLVHLGSAGQGVNRKLVHLGSAGRGINRKRVHLGDAGRGIHSNNHHDGLSEYFAALCDRFRRVRVCCGDWTRVMGETPMFANTSACAAVFLDPPYAETADRAEDLYRQDCSQVAHAVRDWAIAHGDDPRYRVCLAGYDGEHEMPSSWKVIEGKSGQGHGYGCQSKDGYKNAKRERLWFSPHCLDPDDELPLFAGLNGFHEDDEEAACAPAS